MSQQVESPSLSEQPEANGEIPGHRYVARPVEVDGWQITAVKQIGAKELKLELDNGRTYFPTQGMLARMTPKRGDYVVRQLHDGYEYLNPKDVFERKYRKLETTHCDHITPALAAMVSAIKSGGGWSPTLEEAYDAALDQIRQFSAPVIYMADDVSHEELMREIAKAPAEAVIEQKPALERVETIARICHEANRLYCAGLGEQQPPWEEAPDWQRETVIAGVRFHMEHPRAEAGASHESWMAQKVADGWTYGEVKDPEAKTHPCLVPFDDLPPEQQFKDHLFVGIVDAALGR